MMPKNRQTVYNVVRVGSADHPISEYVVCGSYRTPERADEIKGKHEQEMKDSGFGDYFVFEIQATTYYDE